MLTVSASNFGQFLSVLVDAMCDMNRNRVRREVLLGTKKIGKYLLYEWKGLVFLLYLLQTILLLRVLLFKRLCQDKTVPIQEETGNLGSP